MVVSVTRLRLRSVFYLPGFFRYANASRSELKQAEGFVDGRLIAETMLTFWTITRWHSEAEMRAWRGSGAHGRSMSKLAGWCDEASVARWDEGQEAPFPAWQECYRHLLQGRFTTVDRPSAQQRAGKIPEPNFAKERQSMAFTRSPEPSENL